MTGETVRQLQLAILATGLYLSGGADGTFGSSTHRAVTLVQRVNGLPETGVVDAATASVLGLTGSASSPSTPAPAGTVVQLGASGAAVQRVQQLLIKTGCQRRRWRRRRVRPADSSCGHRLPGAPWTAPDRKRRHGDRCCPRDGVRWQRRGAEHLVVRRPACSVRPARQSPSCSKRSWPPASSCAAEPMESSANRRAPPCSCTNG